MKTNKKKRKIHLRKCLSGFFVLINVAFVQGSLKANFIAEGFMELKLDDIAHEITVELNKEIYIYS